ncbi:mechanosensitive ion channel [Marinovum sp. 2_MG-2023]|uniref:mechanosensitive ion channel family protein n=1 Tax=unclassified Marinovum TaxID=2647166 RepID=UPI0026E17018|nr:MULTISPECIES: mechanosensitive ion channel domain-containing protein [unclassified Marinovum]MDO6729674.1 mechanosensitive ion channel [Marinovum sp. 2_MG-2023]MDO6779488.1 mechanosensitive ion channel [Marinovum sp. 1_MG-2023]
MNPDSPAATPLELIQTFLTNAVAWGEFYLNMLMRPWNLYQIGIALGLFGLAWALGHVARPRLHDWMRAREGWPRWRMRFLVMVHRRLRMIIYVIIMWIAVLIMRELTWPSRSYLLGILANLATAWLFVVFATRLIDNPLVRSTVRYGAWIWVTLSILGLTETSQTLLESIAVSMGDTRLSAWLVVQALVMLAVLIAAARFVATVSTARIRRNEDISPSMQVLAVKFLQVLLYGAAFFLGLNLVGVDLTGLAVLSGAIGVGLGFGLQKVVSNLVSGIIILLDKSIKPGDVISLGETFGWINSLGARYVSVVTRDGREYLIPNEDLITGQVVNWSHSSDFVRLDIFFGTAYGDDPHLVRKLAIAAAAGVERVLEHPKTPVCHIVGFGDSSVDYILRFWISDPTGGLTNIRGNVYLALWDTFKEHDISIPFPQREVRMLKDGAHPATDSDISHS